jgi:hypothetical protein
MRDRYLAEDSATNLLERRWFAAERAAAEVLAECTALAQVADLAEASWRSAQARLARLEALRDALGDELATIDEADARDVPAQTRRSAA